MLSTGLVRKAYSSVGRGEVPPALWDQWIEEGILIDFDADTVRRPPTAQVARPTAIEEDLSSEGVKIERDTVPLDKLSKDTLREMAKEVGIPHYHLKKKETLVEELDRLRR